MTNILDATQQFMEAAGQLDNPPTFDSDELCKFRRKLLHEEYYEYLHGEDGKDIAETVDGLLDIIVIAWGTLLAYIGPEKAKAAEAEVVRSNLSKVDGSLGPITKRDDGKVLKPKGWTPPDIAGAIA